MDDLIDGFVRLMDSADALAGTVNLGNPGEFLYSAPPGQIRLLYGDVRAKAALRGLLKMRLPQAEVVVT